MNQPARAEEPPPASEGFVLLYTDNTPGVMVWSHAQVWAAQAQRCEVHVVTNVADFRTAIPSKDWRRVVVTEKHSDGAPAYAGELSSYVNGGGWAFVYRWKEDASHPPQADQIVDAPGASHVWVNGNTVWGYHQTLLAEEKASGTSEGYVTQSFNSVEVQGTSVVQAIGMASLPQGVQPAGAPGDPPPTTCEGILKEQADRVIEAYQIRVANCNEAFAPNPTAVPPRPGNPEKLGECMINAAKALRYETEIKVDDYFVCVAKRTPPAP